MHMLPRVAELEERFPDVLAVVGVHSGKYPAERHTENIRAACARLGVLHPVVNDRHFRVWRDYAVDAWPTLAVVAPDGRLVGRQAGELPVDSLADVISGVAAEYDGAGLLRREPLTLPPAQQPFPEPTGALRFPTRLALLGETLYVSDAGHHRVLELRLAEDGARAEVVRAWGGRAGFADGGSDAAAFREPQGLAVVNGSLLVADRSNHAIRRIDLESGHVTTVAGTGALGEWGAGGGVALNTALRSPFDLLPRLGDVLIAMAGSHQLWSLDLSSGDIRPVAGTGGEDIVDGNSPRALLAQPMGFTTDGTRAFFADAESSAIRFLYEGEVRTVVGTGLFDHGDHDGVADAVRLQHPQALAWHDDAVLVADTYNDKLKRVDPATRESSALPGEAGSGEALWEPTGVVTDGARTFVADTNHHRLCRLGESGALLPVEIV